MRPPPSDDAADQNFSVTLIRSRKYRMDVCLFVLLIEDRTSEAQLLASHVRGKFPGIRVSEVNSRDAWDGVPAAAIPDLVIASGDIGWVSGLELARLVRARWDSVPLMLYEGAHDLPLAYQIFKSGLSECSVHSTEDVVGLLEAITRRIQRLQSLRQKDRQLPRSGDRQECTLTGVFESAPDGNVLYANQALLGILGFATAEECKSVSIDSWHLNPADRLRWQANAEEGAFVELDLHLRRRNGRMMWGRLRVSARRDDRGGVSSYEGSLLDLTEHYEIRECLKRAETRYAALLDAMPSGFLVVDSHSLVVLDSNASARRLFGYGRDEFLQRQVKDLHPRHQIGLITEFKASEDADVEIQCLRRSGGECAAEIRVVSERWDGRDVHLVFYRDISERRHQERILRSFAESLPVSWSSETFWASLCQSGTRSFEGETFLALMVRDAQAKTFRILASAGDVGWVTAGDLPSEGEPWTDLFRRRFLGHARGVQKDFPKSLSLKAAGAEGFLALPIPGHDGTIVGALCVVSKAPLRKIKLAKSLLQLFAAFASQHLAYQVGSAAGLMPSRSDSLSNHRSPQTSPEGPVGP